MSFDSLSGMIAPALIFSIPIVAIVGGIAAQITRTMARTRIQEALIQERIKAMEKGLVPPAAPAGDPLAEPGEAGAMRSALADWDEGGYGRRSAEQRAFGLRLGGAISFAVGACLMFAMWYTGEREAWVWLSIPAVIGMVLFVGSFFVPKPHDPHLGH